MVKKKFDSVLDKVIKEASIILLVLDARRVNESRNRKIENKIKRHTKKIIYVINKIDLISKGEQNQICLPNSVEISAKLHIGTMNLLRKINEVARGKEVIVGICGYPNTGKSTIINALKGKHSAPTSSVSGYTKGLQKVRISSKIMMIDTPGVFERKDEDNISKIVIGAIDADKVDDPEIVACDLISELDGKIERYFKVKKHEDSMDTITEIAIKKNVIKKGGIPDTARMGKEIIRLWQNGKINQS